MFKNICITNRKLCERDFFEQIYRITKSGVSEIILREKDLDLSSYTKLAGEVVRICKENNVPCILHTFTESAMDLGVKNIHLPLPFFRKLSEIDKDYFDRVGTSVHSLSEAKEAVELGAKYIIAGHIYATNSKKDLPARGLAFLKEICDSVEIPVYAIGGIDEDKIMEIKNCGAKGYCRMSYFCKI